MGNNAYKNIMRSYQSIQDSLNLVTKKSGVTYDSPVNFNESMTRPRHRWFPYKEGFSPTFVRSFISEEVKSDTVALLDPFAGVGTAVLEAGMMGGTGHGYDVNPLANFIAITKAITLSTHQLNIFDAEIERFSGDNLSNASPRPDNATVISYFHPEYLDAILRVKSYAQTIRSNSAKSLFMLALLSLVETFSTHRKAGNGLKKKTRLAYEEMSGSPLEQVRAAMVNQLMTYRGDLLSQSSKIDVNYFLASSLDLQHENKREFYDCVLTSPPYANCFDYSKIYMCELWLGDFFVTKDCQRSFRDMSIRSHVHATWKPRHIDFGSRVMREEIRPLISTQSLWSSKIPEMLEGYFMDMGKLLVVMKPYLKKQASVGFVVSNSVYGGIPIATDLLIVEVARKHGYTADRIDVYRNIVPSSQQYIKIVNKEFLRESLVVLRKNN